ncbi:DUF6114 domain-containing protein [Isoptericola sp. NPDC057191]|uniref:DUF6114 domain-containing protein n=1 Tax=Isoptericola sp. NPDC057191 TaxID=3346041 RepID=UPI0036313676
MSDESTSVEASPEGPATRRQRFAAWRVARPFWGGAVTILAGLVLWFSGRLQLDNMEIQLGIEGMQSTLLPVALVLLGVLVMVQPQFRVFYGVITLAIAVYSLLGVNLGGFGIGMVLGVVGGILAVSWMPRTTEDGTTAGSTAGSAGHTAEPAAGPADPRSDGEEVTLAELLPFEDRPARGGRHASVAAAVVVLALGSTGATAVETGVVAPAQVRTASDCWDPLGWLEWACGSADDPGATPSPSPSATDAGTTDDGTAGGGTTDGGTTDDGAATGDGAGDTATEPGATASGDAGGTGSGSGATVIDPSDGAAGATADDQAGTTDDAEKSDKTSDEKSDGEKSDDEPTEAEAQDSVEKEARLELGPCARITFGGEYDLTISLPGDCGRREDANVFSLDADLETRDLQLPLTGINGIDVVNVPVTNDGPRRDALRLSVDSVKVPGFWLKTYADNNGTLGGTVTDADSVSMQGNAQMYISSIHANLPDGEDLADLGEQLVGGASLVEMLLGLTDARIGLMGATSDVQVWSDFREQVWEQ